MLYEWLAAPSGAFNLLNYITFRTGAAVVTAFLVTVLFGVGWLQERLRPTQWLGIGMVVVGVVIIGLR